MLLYLCRPPPIESRRAGLRGGKPEEQTHSSPDENRPSNDQSGVPKAGSDQPESGSNAESENQADAHMASRPHSFENGISNAPETYGEVQDDCNGQQNVHMQNGYHAGWNHNAAPMYQRSFAVGVEPMTTAPYTNANGTNHTFFT